MRLNCPRGVLMLLGIALLTTIRGFGQPARKQESPRADLGRGVAKRSEDKKEISFDLGRGIKVNFVLIRPGSFMMGDENGDDDEKPVHKVTISKPFYLGKFEVTQQQWQAVMGSNPSHFRGAKNPVDRVSWEACQAFIKRLNEKFASRGCQVRPAHRGRMGIRLPRRLDFALQLRRSRKEVGRIRLVRRQRRRHDASGRPEEAQRLGIVRHARQRLGVVRRLVRRRLLQQVTSDRPDGTNRSHLARAPRRLVERSRRLLPLVMPLLPAAVVLRLLLRRARHVPVTTPVLSPFAPRKQRDFRGAKGDFTGL